LEAARLRLRQKAGNDKLPLHRERSGLAPPGASAGLSGFLDLDPIPYAAALALRQAGGRQGDAEGVTTADALACWACDVGGSERRARTLDPAASFNTTSGYIREGRLFKGSSASFALR
jgi:hypothetical protein